MFLKTFTCQVSECAILFACLTSILHVGAAEVTILQRSSTCLVSSEWSKDNFGRNFPEGRDTEVSDFKLASMPWGLMEQVVLEENASGKKSMDAELKQRLALKGFVTNDGRDGLGRSFLVVERFAGAFG
jgi:hypothetical protein